MEIFIVTYQDPTQSRVETNCIKKRLVTQKESPDEVHKNEYPEGVSRRSTQKECLVRNNPNNGGNGALCNVWPFLEDYKFYTPEDG